MPFNIPGFYTQNNYQTNNKVTVFHIDATDKVSLACRHCNVRSFHFNTHLATIILAVLQYSNSPCHCYSNVNLHQITSYTKGLDY